MNLTPENIAATVAMKLTGEPCTGAVIWSRTFLKAGIVIEPTPDTWVAVYVRVQCPERVERWLKNTVEPWVPVDLTPGNSTVESPHQF